MSWHRCALGRRLFTAVLAAVLVPVHAQNTAANRVAPLATTPLEKASGMSWKTECIGRVLIDMPTDRARSWSAQFDHAHVRRLQRPLSLTQFWQGVGAVRDGYAKQKHDEHTSRLGHYERMDARKVAMVMGYQSDASFFALVMWRFVHLDEQHAYEFKQTLSTGDKAPSPELFKPYIDQYTPVLTRIKPLRDGEIPSGEGLCIDGALMGGDTGRNAASSQTMEIAKGTYLSAGYRENLYQVAISSSFETLQRDQDRADFALTLRNDPLGYKAFKVLRRQERTLAGLRGQEFITRTTLNNGHVYYTMLWSVKGGTEGVATPRIVVGLDTPDTAKAPDGSAYVELLPEPELIALWDGALATLRIRPGALPAGQVLRSVN